MAKRETCAVYIRKSTDDNKRQKYTVEKQRKWAAKTIIEEDLQNILDDGEFFMETVSAKEARRRKQYNRLIEEIQRGKVDHLVVYHPDRITRNKIEAAELVDLFRQGVFRSIICSDATYRYDKEAEIESLEDLLELAYRENRHHSKKTKDGMKEGFIQGKHMGKIPFGYKALLGGEIEVMEDEMKLVCLAFSMRKAGRQYQEIIQSFSEAGFKKYPGTIAKMLGNPFYYGYMRSSKYDDLPLSAITVSGFRPFITKELFDAANADTTKRGARMVDREYFLNGIVMGEDGRKAIPSETRGHVYYKQAKKTPYSYHVSQDDLFLEITRRIESFNIPEHFIEVLRLYMEAKLRINFEEMKTEVSGLKTQIRKREEGKKSAKRRFIEGDIEKSEYDEYIQEVDEEISIHQTRLDATEQGIEDIQSQVDRMADILRDVPKAYRKAEGWERTKILRLLGIRVIVKQDGVFQVEGNQHFFKNPTIS